MLVAEAFLGSLVKLYGKHIVCSDCGRTWCPEACSSLGLTRILRSLFEKGIIERVVESVKDRTECFDDYYPCLRKSDCNLSHVYLWIILLVYVYDRSGFTFGKINQWLRNG